MLLPPPHPPPGGHLPCHAALLTYRLILADDAESRGHGTDLAGRRSGSYASLVATVDGSGGVARWCPAASVAMLMLKAKRLVGMCEAS